MKRRRAVFFEPVFRWIRSVRATIRMRRAAREDVRTVFREIYRQSSWGSAGDGYFSGLGSLDINSRDYVTYVNRFLADHGIVEIVDCGCGDFRVAKLFDLSGRRYVGVDIADELIEENRARYGLANVDFRNLDILEDDLPDGQLCLIRQVLQHLSNESIERVLRKLDKYQYVIITDAQLTSARRCNVDIASFSGTRADVGSSLLLEREPFNRSLEVVLNTPIAHRDDVVLRSVLLRH